MTKQKLVVSLDAWWNANELVQTAIWITTLFMWFANSGQGAGKCDKDNSWLSYSGDSSVLLVICGVTGRPWGLLPCPSPLQREHLHAPMARSGTASSLSPGVCSVTTETEKGNEQTVNCCWHVETNPYMNTSLIYRCRTYTADPMQGIWMQASNAQLTRQTAQVCRQTCRAKQGMEVILITKWLYSRVAQIFLLDVLFMLWARRVCFDIKIALCATEQFCSYPTRMLGPFGTNLPGLA